MSLNAEQMELRRNRVGSSEAGALIEIDPYKDLLDVYMAKALPPLIEEDDHRLWGLDLEPAILRHYVRKMHYELLPPPGSLVHPTLPLVCTPDALAMHDGVKIDLQLKNDQGWGQTEWGEPGTDEAPLLYVAQVTVELGVLRATGHDVDHAELVVSIRGAPPVAYRIDFNEELFAGLADLAVKFVRDHLERGIPPEGTPRAEAEYVRRRFAKHDDVLLEATPERTSLVQVVKTLRSSKRDCEEELLVAETALKAAIGEAAGIQNLCTWKLQTRAAHAVKESTSRVLRIIKSKEG